MSGDYEVGYGKPPKASRFVKGRSGNPAGSSRKARARSKARARAPRSVDEIVLEEAYRSMQLREGDEMISIPAVQAHMRALSLAGLKGSRIAMKDFLTIVQAAERRRGAEVLEGVRVALDYKENYARLVELRTAKKLPPPLPHPDDVVIDHRAGTVTIVGPMTHDEREHLKRMLNARALVQKEVAAQQADIEEGRLEGCEPLPCEMKAIPIYEAFITHVDDRLEAMGWLPRLAGDDMKDSAPRP